MNNRGNAFGQLIVGIILSLITIVLIIAFIPGFNEIIDIGKSNSYLNCKGYTDTDDPTESYNASIGEKSTIGCVGLNFIVPILVLSGLALIGGYLYFRTQGSVQVPVYSG